MPRIAIVGLGAAASHIHVPAYRRIPELEIVGGVDLAPRSSTFAFPRYASVEQLLDVARPDIVTIATPTAAHYPIARQALERGVDVFCEKPFTETVEQGAELVRLARRHGARIVVNNEFRFMACHRTAKQLIGTPEFGELIFVHLHQTFRTTAGTEAGWRGDDPERTCKEFGTHVFDLCRYFFGAEPLRLLARMPRPGNAGGPDLLNLIDLEFPGDRWARITLDRLTRGRHRYLDTRLDGTAATVEAELGGHLALEAGVRASTRRPYVSFDLSMGGRAFLYQGESRRKLAADPLDLFANATSELMRSFLAARSTGAEPACSGSDNLRTLALMRAAYQSAAADREIDLRFLAELP